MKKNLRNFITTLRSERLSNKERSTIRSALELFIYTHPNQEHVKERPWRQRGEAFHRFRISLLMVSRRAVIAMVIIAAAGALSGGISYAAENTTPGDVLYPIKLYVNEGIRSALTLSDGAKASWEVQRMERRFEEAEYIIARGELDSETVSAISNNFEGYAERIKQHIEKLQAKNDLMRAVEVSSELDAALHAHTKILARLNDRLRDATTTLTLLYIAHGQTDESDSIQSNIHELVSEQSGHQVETAAKNKKKVALNKIGSVKNLLNSIKQDVDSDSIEQIESQLEKANLLLNQGINSLNAGAFAGAFKSFQLAHKEAQEAKVIMNAHRKLGALMRPVKTATGTATMTLPWIDNDDQKNDDENDTKASSTDEYEYTRKAKAVDSDADLSDD